MINMKSPEWYPMSLLVNKMYHPQDEAIFVQRCRNDFYSVFHQITYRLAN